jgi:acetolactate synthase-1/2/3 large subunit
MTGRMQAVLIHAGVGVLQGSMGVHAALQAEVPMVVMSGESTSLGEDPDLAIEPQWYGGLTVGGIERFIEPVTKWARQVLSPHTLYESVVRAGEMAQRPPMGPIYLNVPLEHMLHPWELATDARDVPPAPKVVAPANEVEKVAGLLAKAKSPVIVTETSGRDPAGFGALVELAELVGAPVIAGRSSTTANFPSDNPLYLGMANYEALKDADLVLLLSARAPWYPARIRPTSGKIVAINDVSFKGHMIYQNLHADMYLEGDVTASLQLLAEAVRSAGVNAKAVTERRARWAKVHASHVGGLRSAEKKAMANGKIEPLAVCTTLAEVMPENTIVFDETITHSMMLRQHLPMTGPQSFFRGYGGLGQGIGTAMGIKLAAPERPVVLFVGDGSFLYNPIVQALGASKQHELPVLIIVMNNRHYEAMRGGHVHHYPGGAAESADLWHGVHINGPNYEELGAPFGLAGQRVEKLGELKAALQSGLNSVKNGKTAILNVSVSK